MVLSSGCSSKPDLKPLMPTPVVITEVGTSSLKNIPPEERWTSRQVFFLTNRERDPDLRRINYTNAEAEKASVGLALVEFGDPDFSWEDLENLSLVPERKEDIPLSISGIVKAGFFRGLHDPEETDPKGATKWWLEKIDQTVEAAPDKDIMIYVHGAKVNFYNACVFAAQLDHFMGRDMTPIAFSWPTRQNILAYGFGGDVARAYRSAETLADLVELLALKTEARRIHIICWSAGGRVVTQALSDLRSRYPEMNRENLAERLRVGTVYFAAADVPEEDFIEALPALDDVAHRLIVTASTNDGALKNATRFMGGGTRIGQVNTDLTPEHVEIVSATQGLEVVDVSFGAEDRGFDITGHSYWFDHPWASSDVVLAIRSDLEPEDRGLEATENPIRWRMPPDYPDRLRKSMLRPDLDIRQQR